MKSSLSLPVFGLTLICGLSLISGAKWSYEGHAGPKHWHELFPQACSGESQSPIDLRPEQTVYNPDLKDFAIWYDPPKPGSKFYIKNNGHALQVDLEGEFYVSNGGLQDVYRAAQFHFHWGHKSHHGSEHTIDGVASPIEMHLVTWNQDKFATIGEAVPEKEGLAVLGVMFEISEEDNPVLEYIIRGIKHVRNPEEKQRIELPLLSIRDLLPKDISRYYRYQGSLTTPNCFESVTWTVFDQTQTISRKQLREFRSLLQLRHKHRKGDHKGAGHSRHRRSLTMEEKIKERHAKDLLEEAGIKGDLFEEDALRLKLLTMGDKMMGDMPVASKAGENQVAAPENHTKPQAASHEQTLISPTETEVVEFEYKQSILVNNFRPVQPLNGRQIERSFKLRDPVYEVAGRKIAVDNRNVDCDGASSKTSPLAAIVFTFMFLLMLH